MNRAAIILIASLLAISSLSACGRRGSLDLPAASANPAASTDSAQPKPVEDKPFILDGLIQ